MLALVPFVPIVWYLLQILVVQELFVVGREW